MDDTTAFVAAGAIWQEPCVAAGSFDLNSPQLLSCPCTREVKSPCASENHNIVHDTAAQLPWLSISISIMDCPNLDKPIELVGHHTWEQYIGQPMVQDVRDTCVLVACTVCLEAKHRLQHEKLHRMGTLFPYRVAPPSDLLEACDTAGFWNPGVGAYVRDVLYQIRVMGGVLATTTGAPTPAHHFLTLRSWEEHRWDDFAGSALSPGRVADLLYKNGPCIGVLWVSPEYCSYDADRDDARVYTSGCGRSDDAKRNELEKRYPGRVGWHAVVCIGFRGGGRHVLVLDNHKPTGPRRWIDVEEFHAFYILNV